MNKKNCYTKLSICFINLLLALIVVSANAQVAPPPPGTAEVYVCNYNSGKDRGDLLAARDYYVKQLAKAKVEPGLSVVLHKYKGGAPIDFLWISFHQSMSAFAASAEAEFSEPALQSALARFGSVASCVENLGIVRGVFQDPTVSKTDPTFMTSAACTARSPMSAGDVQDLRGHINDVLGGMDSFNSVFMFSIQPVTEGPDQSDVYLFAAHDSVTGWAKRMQELSGSEAGQSLRRHFEATMDCGTTLWRSERVVGEGARAGS